MNDKAQLQTQSHGKLFGPAHRTLPDFCHPCCAVALHTALCTLFGPLFIQTQSTTPYSPEVSGKLREMMHPRRIPRLPRAKAACLPQAESLCHACDSECHGSAQGQTQPGAKADANSWQAVLCVTPEEVAQGRHGSLWAGSPWGQACLEVPEPGGHTAPSQDDSTLRNVSAGDEMPLSRQ